MEQPTIKVGDKVRVSKDAPRIYVGFADVSKTEFIVGIIDDGVASVHLENDEKTHAKIFVIPTKYLIKVDAEAKEAKFKKGDKVRFKKIYTVVSVDDGQVFIDSAGNHIDEDCLELYTEPTAPKIEVGDRVIVKPDAPNMCKSVDVFKRINSVVTKIENGKATLDIDRLGDDSLELFDVPLEYIQKVDAIEHLHNHGWGDLGEFTPIPMSANPIIGFEQSYWQRYEADLAKEIAVKVANKYNDPAEAADYAVSVAKAVVENLKKK